MLPPPRTPGCLRYGEEYRALSSNSVQFSPVQGVVGKAGALCFSTFAIFSSLGMSVTRPSRAQVVGNGHLPTFSGHWVHLAWLGTLKPLHFTFNVQSLCEGKEGLTRLLSE